MATTESQCTPSNAYLYGLTDQDDVERLDGMHQGIKTYLNGNAFLAPLDNPRTILDIGTGSGIWLVLSLSDARRCPNMQYTGNRAIDIAEKFPDAQVTAVDISPMLPRPVPSNFQFQQFDILADPLPWEPSSFDAVHVRFFLIHLPNPQRVLERIIRLVKPGGWLLVEEAKLTGEVMGDAPAVRTTYALLCKALGSNGKDARVSEKLESWIWKTGSFSEVNVHGVIVPMGNFSSDNAITAQSHIHQQDGRLLDSKVRALGRGFTDVARLDFSTGKHRAMEALGFTPEVKSQCVQQFSASEWWMDMRLYFVWARKCY